VDPKDQARQGYRQRRQQVQQLQGQDLMRAQLASARLANTRLAEDAADARQLAGLTVTEPLTYRRGGEHSFFLDVARAERGMNAAGARDRLARHRREMDAELPRRAAARDRAARSAYEAAFYSTAADRRAVDQMLAAGVSPFERRASSTTPGQGGYLAPPLWLVDQYVPFARAAAPFASRWHQMDLPPGISEVNVPRLVLGAATGPQPDLAPVAARDIADSLVSAPVRTIAGHADASRQWLEQGSGASGFGTDELIFADLTADLEQNCDGQALLGAGSNGQLLGVWPAGAITAANGIVQADSNNVTGQTWTVASAGASLHVQAAQLASVARRIRNSPAGWAWYWHPWVWSLYTAQVDSQGRPLVNSQDCDGLPDGVMGYYQNIPVVADTNIPTTFGGTLAPYIGALTAGQSAAVPGSGTGASYTPLLLARGDDLFMFSGDIHLQVLQEVLTGSAQVRFQARQYLAAMPNRYVAAAAVGSSVGAGGDVAHATLTWQQANSLLILSGSGY
jgi:hypothetical protein